MATSQRLIKVTDASYVFPLRQFGPIVTPTYVTESIVYNMVRRGHTVIEIDPLNRSRQVKLTTTNFYQKDRFAPKDTTPKVDNTALIGKDLTGVATKVNTIPKDRVVAEEIEEITRIDSENITTPKTTPLSRAERKRLAKEKRKEEAAAAAAAAEEATATEDNTPEVTEEPVVEETTETTEE